MVKFAPLCGCGQGVAIWRGHMMLHFMVVMYNHFQGTKRLMEHKSPELLKAAPKNLLSKPVLL